MERGKVRLGISAPDDVKVMREELLIEVPVCHKTPVTRTEGLQCG